MESAQQIQRTLKPHLCRPPSSTCRDNPHPAAPRYPSTSAAPSQMDVFTGGSARHSQAVQEWENTVASITFHGGTPPEVWGTGLTPQEWRTQDVSNISSLHLAALSTFKLLRANLHARKRKEFSIWVSVHIAQREENILVADVHGGIQSLLNERPANPPLEQYDFGDAEYTPRDPAELPTI